MLKLLNGFYYLYFLFFHGYNLKLVFESISNLTKIQIVFGIFWILKNLQRKWEHFQPRHKLMKALTDTLSFIRVPRHRIKLLDLEQSPWRVLIIFYCIHNRYQIRSTIVLYCYYTTAENSIFPIHRNWTQI